MHIDMSMQMWEEGSQRTAWRNWFSPSAVWDPGYQTQVVRLGGQHPYPLSHVVITGAKFEPH